MKIFVTGGTGFVGRYAVEELLKHGHTVLVLSRGKHKPMRRLTFLRGDLSTMAKWEGAVRRFKPQGALHLAWEGIPDYGPENSMRNLAYGIDLMHLLGRIGCKKVVSTGSCWEYGAESGKVSESTRVKIMNAFTAAKSALHGIGEAIAKESGMSFVWGIIFYIYGPGQKATSLIPHLITNKLQNIPPSVKNPNGGNDFVYVADVARALRMLLEKKTPSSVYNLGSGKLTSVREIANLVYGKKVLAGSGKAVGFYADISRIKKELGWKATTDVKAGIRKMIASYR